MADIIDRFDLDGPYGYLSNFWPSPLRFAGHTWPTVEHAFQGAKTLDPIQRARVLAAPTPSKAKYVGRSVNLRADWETVKTPVMRGLVARKFEDPELAAKLLATGTARLIEGNTWNDSTWGCVQVGGEWVGEKPAGTHPHGRPNLALS